jgi:hypothetical protein
MLLQLNAFLLRQGISPVRAISTASLPDTSFALWTNNRLEPLEVADGDLLDAAVPGDVIVVLVRRPIAPPAWQQFIQDALALPDFGRASSALGAILFCATGDGTPAGGQSAGWVGASGSGGGSCDAGLPIPGSGCWWPSMPSLPSPTPCQQWVIRLCRRAERRG